MSVKNLGDDGRAGQVVERVPVPVVASRGAWIGVAQRHSSVTEDFLNLSILPPTALTCPETVGRSAAAMSGHRLAVEMPPELGWPCPDVPLATSSSTAASCPESGGTMAEELVTLKDAAAMSERSARTIRRWVKQGVLSDRRPSGAPTTAPLLLDAGELRTHLVTMSTAPATASGAPHERVSGAPSATEGQDIPESERAVLQRLVDTLESERDHLRRQVEQLRQDRDRLERQIADEREARLAVERESRQLFGVRALLRSGYERVRGRR